MIKVTFDNECANKAKNIENIIDQSHLSSVRQNLELNINKNNIFFLNYEFSPPSKVQMTENGDTRDKSLIYRLFPKKNAKILDCTGGFGKDAMKFSKLGYKVTMIEENPLIVSMLKDFFDKNKKISINLMYGNAFDYMRLHADTFDYIYIDTLFKKAKNKSKSKKGVEILQYICKERISRSNLIKQAVKQSCRRIIIKESTYSLLKYDFDYTIKTKLVRYNILKGNI
tara:strand:- start:1838 stop:2518 length:681 start_codon:yes stop_codon:yes gene_type:complete